MNYHLVDVVNNLKRTFLLRKAKIPDASPSSLFRLATETWSSAERKNQYEFLPSLKAKGKHTSFVFILVGSTTVVLES